MFLNDRPSHRLIPETKGRSLEEMDVIFGSVKADKRGADIEIQQKGEGSPSFTLTLGRTVFCCSFGAANSRVGALGVLG
jgi:hypothetical protein